MVDAFVMIETEAGAVERSLAAVRELDAVTEAHIVAGAYDIIAETTGERVYDVLDASSSGVQRLDGVTDTTTYIAMD
ncbi:Lrp/AsnC ligand binding domain-containing protein [Halobellus rubicundus]|uniref:Lrp/AsnC ligand binding domain-containing protein n=1 Tax=Halobellus rubicundus TaxID=2996466 RepID=A0ABD5MK64_9EURY